LCRRRATRARGRARRAAVGGAEAAAVGGAGPLRRIGKAGFEAISCAVTTIAYTRSADGLAEDAAVPGPAAACSFGNGGAIGPNTCTPSAMPGMLRKIPNWSLDPDGPVTVSKARAMKSGPRIPRWLLDSRNGRALKSSRAMQNPPGPDPEIYREGLGSARHDDLVREEGISTYRPRTRPSGAGGQGCVSRDLGLPSQSFEGAALQDFCGAVAELQARRARRTWC